MGEGRENEGATHFPNFSALSQLCITSISRGARGGKGGGGKGSLLPLYASAAISRRQEGEGKRKSGQRGKKRRRSWIARRLCPNVQLVLLASFD